MNDAVMERLKQAEPVFYPNPHYDPKQIRKQANPKVDDAARRLERFARFFPGVSGNRNL